MIRIADTFLWLIRAGSVALLALLSLNYLVVLRSFDVGFRIYQSVDYYVALLVIMGMVAGVCAILKRVKIPALVFAVAILLVHVGFSLEERAFLRAHHGEATDPTPRFVDTSWLSIEEKGNLHGGGGS